MLTDSSLYYHTIPLIYNTTSRISTLIRALQPPCYKCHRCRRHCAGVVVSLSGAETRPSIRAVQRCFVRSNSISEFLYRTHHISKQTPGQCALRCLHKAKNTHSTTGDTGANPHSLTHSPTVALPTTTTTTTNYTDTNTNTTNTTTNNNNNESLVFIQMNGKS